MGRKIEEPGIPRFQTAHHVEHMWDEITRDENLVFSLYVYRKLRIRALRGESMANDRDVLARIEPQIRQPNPVNPLGYRRFKCSLPGTLVVWRGQPSEYPITLVDMSATGARVQHVEGLEIGTRVLLRVPQRIVGEIVMDWHANVVWTQGGHVGMHFLENRARD